MNGDWITHQVAFHPLESLPTDLFRVIAPQNEVEKYFAELQMARIKLKAHQAAQDYNWTQVEALIKEMENLKAKGVEF